MRVLLMCVVSLLGVKYSSSQSVNRVELSNLVQDLMSENSPEAHTMAAGYMWMLWYDTLKSSPNAQPSPQLSGNLAATLGNCARVLCSNEFTVSPCLDDLAHMGDKNSVDEAKNNISHVNELFANSALVSVPGNEFMLTRQRVFNDDIMVISSRKITSADETTSSNSAETDNCWLYPGEHMSFSLLHSLEMERMKKGEAEARGGSTNLNINSGFIDSEESMINDKTVLVFDQSIGSLLHLLGIENWFHVLREGLGGIIFLAMTLPENTPILLPDAPIYKRVVSLLPSDYFSEHALVYVSPHVKKVVVNGPGHSIFVPDWRPQGGGAHDLSSTQTSAPPGSSLYDMKFIEEHSASVLKAIRMLYMQSANQIDEIIEHRKNTMKIVYVTRSDAKIRKVNQESKLIRAIKTAINNLVTLPPPSSDDSSSKSSQLSSPSCSNSSSNNNNNANSRCFNETCHSNHKEEKVKYDSMLCFQPLLPDYSLSQHRLRKASIKSVMLEGLPLKDTIKIFKEADVVIGPHGAGLFNAALFSRKGTVVVSFGLVREHESKEDNLIATCKAVGIPFISLPCFLSSFMGNYELKTHQSYEDVADCIVSHLLYGF